MYNSKGKWGLYALYDEGFYYIYEDDSYLIATVYEHYGNALLISQAKEIRDQLQVLNGLISKACGEGLCTEELFKSQVQTSKLLKACRGETQTCKN